MDNLVDKEASNIFMFITLEYWDPLQPLLENIGNIDKVAYATATSEISISKNGGTE